MNGFQTDTASAYLKTRMSENSSGARAALRRINPISRYDP
jgi:hypothetical protein